MPCHPLGIIAIAACIILLTASSPSSNVIALMNWSCPHPHHVASSPYQISPIYRRCICFRLTISINFCLLIRIYNTKLFRLGLLLMFWHFLYYWVFHPVTKLTNVTVTHIIERRWNTMMQQFRELWDLLGAWLNINTINATTMKVLSLKANKVLRHRNRNL